MSYAIPLARFLWKWYLGDEVWNVCPRSIFFFSFFKRTLICLTGMPVPMARVLPMNEPTFVTVLLKLTIVSTWEQEVLSLAFCHLKEGEWNLLELLVELKSAEINALAYRKMCLNCLFTKLTALEAVFIAQNIVSFKISQFPYSSPFPHTFRCILYIYNLLFFLDFFRSWA